MSRDVHSPDEIAESSMKALERIAAALEEIAAARPPHITGYAVGGRINPDGDPT